jgi:histidyl-tRNA synthetase
MQTPARSAPASFLKHAVQVASFYGFRPLREIEKRVPGLERRAHSFSSAAHASVQHTVVRPGEPVLAYWASGNPVHLPAGILKSAPPTGKHGDVAEFGLNIVGVPEPIAEVVLLKAVSTILTDWGAGVARIRLNVMGDKDSKARFEREVALYLRKHSARLEQACRDSMAENPLSPYRCANDLCRAVVESGPRAMNFLSEKSRLHFKEVLEHLEKLSMPYEFDDLLMGDERESRTMFAFDLAAEDATVLGGAGGRFDDYFRKFHGRPTAQAGKDVSGVSASVYFRKKGLAAQSFQLGIPATSPDVYFIQLGLRAKLEGLAVVDLLRHAQIPVLQSFDSDKLSPQLLAAKDAGVSHLIIMGAREALDRTVLVRAMNDSHQTIVGLGDLPRFLKTLR